MKTTILVLLLFISAISFSQTPCNPSTVDYGNKTYHTVQIGSQCWLKENLNIGTMIHVSSNATSDTVIQKYCYNNDPNNCEIYGGLYQWNEAMGYSSSTKGICPQGWHIPTQSDYEQLYNFLGGQADKLDENNHIVLPGAGAKMKETGLTYYRGYTTDPKLWKNMYATNSSGFSSRGAGLRWHSNKFVYLWTDFNMWLSTSVNATTAYYGGNSYSTGNANFGQFYKTEGLSVRCLKD